MYSAILFYVCVCIGHPYVFSIYYLCSIYVVISNPKLVFKNKLCNLLHAMTIGVYKRYPPLAKYVLYCNVVYAIVGPRTMYCLFSKLGLKLVVLGCGNQGCFLPNLAHSRSQMVAGPLHGL